MKAVATFKDLAIKIDLVDDGSPGDEETLSILESERVKETAFIGRFEGSAMVGEAVRSITLSLRPF